MTSKLLKSKTLKNKKMEVIKMGTIRVTAATLKSKAGELKSLNEKLKSDVNNLESTEQNLTSMWEGEAKQAFHNAFHSDKVQMDNFARLIDVYVQKLETIAEKYASAESTNVSTATTRKYR